ncbi:hypothetical protein CDL15_Pgr026819 [Punica granatum]|uniref:Uncharacterized protein n=1 Tax=Punica granatum TaxID=22663 RepID=A0A218WLP2_PUNGR|nr:hypothetical protein CDL15_Pgr026819 [Punica granatum]
MALRDGSVLNHKSLSPFHGLVTGAVKRISRRLQWPLPFLFVLESMAMVFCPLFSDDPCLILLRTAYDGERCGGLTPCGGGALDNGGLYCCIAGLSFGCRANDLT